MLGFMVSVVPFDEKGHYKNNCGVTLRVYTLIDLAASLKSS
jgi:hypothetical protein